MRILIVDDHPLVRKGLSSTLSFDDKVKEIKEAGSIEEAIMIMSESNPEVTIIDLNLGSEDGLELIQRARNKNITTKFIVVTSSLKKEDFIRAQKAEVDGYILKEAFAEDILYGFSVVIRGKKFFDPEVMKYQLNQDKATSVETLTGREKDILNELGKGLSNLEIAQRLFISEHTVKKHVSNILSKLNLKHRTEAAIYINNTTRFNH
ncbi:response regulator protein VraR [Clostridium aceticum]|uniref:Stage 0 sporulation protein A homolog n=1 Tax=Clostridium aceticum TaxID=84022 RepID=A0A0D8IE82_9CLOT|nr:response regulator transcription factor [Clostridium aceticum]AKL94399.1 response regulator protein VraR [Clostridium aceticum]KJF28374.1 nitrate/nitrite response regulator protein narL [Clostridium aceticum]